MHYPHVRSGSEEKVETSTTGAEAEVEVISVEASVVDVAVGLGAGAEVEAAEVAAEDTVLTAHLTVNAEVEVTEVVTGVVTEKTASEMIDGTATAATTATSQEDGEVAVGGLPVTGAMIAGVLLVHTVSLDGAAMKMTINKAGMSTIKVQTTMMAGMVMKMTVMNRAGTVTVITNEAAGNISHPQLYTCFEGNRCL